VERTRARQDLDALTHDALAPAQICKSLEKFETLWPDFTQEEKREFVGLMVARIDVHSGKGKTEGSENARLVELKVKLHLPELLGGGADAESTARRLCGRRPSFTLDATVALAVGTGDTVILAPFHRRVTMGQPKKVKKESIKRKDSEHPFERALRWSSALENRSNYSARQLAKLEKTSEPTVSMTLSLMRLTPSIRETLHLLIATGSAYHLGLRVLAKIAALPAQKQEEAFASLLVRWGIETTKSASEKL